MGELFDKISSDEDPITKLLSKIPGFSGYIERKERRDADKLLREQIAKQFEVYRVRVGELQEGFASAGELTYLDDLEKAAMKLQTFIDKVSNAEYGYSGFFDAVKINEEELAKIYQFDLALLDLGDEISAGIENVTASVDTDGLPAAIRHLVGLTRDLVTTFEGRDEILVAIE
ncbi:MAG: hypothetical protein ABFS17_01050 [Chloroflexota bacterium]